MTQFDPSKKIARNPDIIATEMDGDVVMMSIEHGQYYGLEDVGARVWGLLEQPMTVAELVMKLQDEYEVQEAVCEADLRLFLEQMWENGVILQS